MIAERVGVCERTVLRTQDRRGVPSLVRHALSSSEIERAVSLLADGASYREVGRTLGRAASTIKRRLPGMSSWKPGGGVEYRRYMEALDALAPPLKIDVAKAPA